MALESLKKLIARMRSSQATTDNVGRPDNESATTAANTLKPKQRQQLVLGLDFGTAYTKVVIGETRKHFAVPFEAYCDGGNPYLLKSRFFVDEDGCCSLDSKAGREITDLKMRILDNRCTAQDEIYLATYMALVMRHARQWLLSEHADLYGQSDIDWLINVGLPTDSYHDDDLVRLYGHITRAAWAACFSANSITSAVIEDWLVKLGCEDLSSESEGIVSEDDVHLFPEFVAQITGYVRSPMRQNEQLHMLIDIGAGTVDISLFNVMEVGGEDRFPIMARAVEKLGTAYLMRSRLEAAGRPLRNIPAHLPVPPRGVLAKRLGAAETALKKSDNAFRDRLFKRILAVLEYTRAKRYPRAFRPEKKLTTFLCGGGARVDLYQELGKILRAPGGARIELIPLSLPEGLDAPGASDKEYDRLSVAYGLSFDPFDIGDIVKANEIEDLELEAHPVDQLSNYPEWYKS